MNIKQYQKELGFSYRKARNLYWLDGGISRKQEERQNTIIHLLQQGRTKIEIKQRLKVGSAAIKRAREAWKSSQSIVDDQMVWI